MAQHLCSEDPTSARYSLYGGFMLGLFFNPEDGKDMFLRNVS
jgi:hypothetical protein